MEDFQSKSITNLFEEAKEALQDVFSEKIEFYTLKQSPYEIIYTCSMQGKEFVFSNTARLFIYNGVFYSITHLRASEKKLSDDDILKIKENLETIKVRE